MLLIDQLQIRGSYDFILKFIHMLEGLVALRITTVIEGRLRNTDEQPDAEVLSIKSGSVLSTGASVPVKLGCVILRVWVYSSVCKLFEPQTFGVLCRLSHRHDQSLTPFLALLLQAHGGWV